MKRGNLAKLLLGVLLIVICVSSMAACQTKVFTVTFDSNGGTQVASIQVNNKGTVKEPTAPTKSGYKFSKWVKEDGSDFGFGTEPVTKDITLKAIWETSVYTVTFQTYGGSPVPTQSVAHNGTATRPATDPTKTGQFFYDWFANQNFTTAFDFSTKIVKDTTVYARFLTKIDDIFTVKFAGSDTAIPDQKTNEGGILTSLPVPSGGGGVFIGWWLSHDDNSEKLTCQYINQVLAENTTLFAVWEGSAPAVSVNSDGITWTGKGVTASYTITITFQGTILDTRTVSSTEYAYDFTGKAMGEYQVEVSFDGNKTTVFYKNKALSKVSLSNIESLINDGGSVFVFNAVKNTEKYLITVDCGNKDSAHVQRHTDFEIDKDKPWFNFEDCEMQQNGINFTVQAVAAGYLTSTSKAFNLKRGLSKVTNIDIVDATERFKWDSVPNATYYMVQINNGTAVRVNGELSDSVKEYNPGLIKIKIYAVAHGYNPSEPAEFSYTKQRLASPAYSSIILDGDILSWGAVDGAVRYNVKIGTEIKDAGLSTEFQLPSMDATDIEISVQTVGNTPAEHSLFSDAKSFSATLENHVFYKNGLVYWSTIFGAKKYGMQLNDEPEKIITGGETSVSVEFTNTELQTIKVRFYDKDENESAWETITVQPYEVRLSYNFENHEDLSVLYLAVGDNIYMPTQEELEKEEDDLTGYTLKHWSATETGSEYTKTTLETAKDLVLYAIWTPNKYIISFDCTGGTMTVESFEVTYRQTFVAPVPTPDDVCKAFAGWRSQPNGAGRPYTNHEGNSTEHWTEASDNVIFYASWVDIFTFNKLSDGTYSVSKADGITLVSSITIPAKYNDIAVTVVDGPFQSSNLIEVNIPDTIQLVALGKSGGNTTGSAFLLCTNLQRVNVYKIEGNHEVFYYSYDGALFRRSKNTVALVYFPFGKTGNYVMPYGIDIPDEDNIGKTKTIPVTDIPNHVFFGTKISQITIRSGVENVGESAFGSCTLLTKVTFEEISEGVTDRHLSMGKDVFSGCTLLKEIVLPTRYTDFNVRTFSSCAALEKLYINGVKKEGSYTVKDYMLCSSDGETIIYCPRGRTGDLIIPGGVLYIGDNAFSNPIPNTSTEKGAEEFTYNGARISKLIIPGYVRVIGMQAFRGCTALTAIIFEGDASSEPLTIKKAAFYGCSNSAFTQLVLPENLITMEVNAFGDTRRLVKVTVNGNGALSNDGKLHYADMAFATFGISADTGAVPEPPKYYVTDLYFGPNTSFFSISGVFGDTVARVIVDPANEEYAADKGVLYNKDFTEIVFYPSARDDVFVMLDSVKSIGANLFKNKTNLTEIVIGENVTLIGAHAFEGCTNLVKVDFKPNNTAGASLVIQQNAFYQCTNLRNFVLPDHVTSIGEYAFQYCSNLVTITIPSGVNVIQTGLFWYCTRLETVILSEGVEEMKDEVFSNCSAFKRLEIPSTLNKMVITESNGLYNTFSGSLSLNTSVLETITVADGNAKFVCNDGVLYGLTEGVITDLYYCPPKSSGTAGKVDIPKTVKKIWAKAFYKSAAITTITFSQGIQTDLVFGASVFDGCTKLAKVELPEGLKTVSAGLFQNCSALTEVVIPGTVTKMEVNVFSACTKLSTITFSPGTEALEIEDGSAKASYGYNGVFVGCIAIEQIEFPARTTKIGAFAFAEYLSASSTSAGTYVLNKVIIPAGVTSIGEKAFYANYGRNNLSTVEFVGTSKLETIGSYAFYGCPLTAFSMPASVNTIGDFAFGSKSATDWARIKGVTLAQNGSLETIGKNAFEYSALKSITIPASVVTIDDNAFKDCSLLETVTLTAGNLKKIGYKAFGKGTGTEGTYAVGCIKLDAIQIPASVESIGDSAFNNCTALSSVEFDVYPKGHASEDKSSIKSIGQLAFANTAISQLIFPTSTSSSITLGQSMFQGAKKLTYVYLSKSITSIDNVFKQSYVQVIEVDPNSANFRPDANYPIMYSADGKAIMMTFGMVYGNDEVEEGVYRIAEGITQIGTGAFRNQASLKKIIVASTVEKIGESAFANCRNLEEIVFMTDTRNPDTGWSNIKEIGASLFENCFKLRYVNLSRTEITFLPALTFANCLALEEVKLPETLKRIGVDSDTLNTSTSAYTFSNCQKLKTINSSVPGVVNIPNGVTSINGTNNFRYCTSLGKVVLPSSLKVISEATFANSALKEIVFQSQPTDFAGSTTGVFNNCQQLEKVVLWSKMTRLGGTSQYPTAGYGQYMFSGCSALKTITYDGYEPAEDEELGVGEEDGKNVLPPNLEFISQYTFQNCTSLKNITIPGATRIGYQLFSGCTSLQSAHLPKALIDNPSTGYLMGNVFQNCIALTEVELNPNLEFLGNNMFKGCKALQTIKLPDNLVYFGTNTFENSGLTSIKIPSRVENMGSSNSAATITSLSYVFAGCTELTTVELPAGLATMGGAFNGCTKLSKITYTGQTDYETKGNSLPPSLTILGSSSTSPAFGNCTALTKLRLPGVTKLGGYAFSGSGIESIDISGVTDGTTASLGTYTFNNCTALNSVTLNMNLTALSEYMFLGCKALQSIKLPDSLTYMGRYTFQNSGLTSIKIPTGVQHMGNGSGTPGVVATDVYIFDGCTNLATVELPAGLLTMGGRVFQNCEKLKKITYTGYPEADYESKGNSLPTGLNLIGRYSFAGCIALQNIVVPGVTTLGDYVFDGCKTLSAVKLNDNLTTLAQGTFRNCTALETVTLPKELTSIVNDSFSGSGLISLTITSKVSSIAAGSFDGCAGLTGFAIDGNTNFKVNANGILFTAAGQLLCCPPGVGGIIDLSEITSIASYAFYNCKGITGVTFSTTAATTIGSYAFYGCSFATKVVIPKVMTAISQYAFYYCSFTSLEISEGVTTINQYAFRYCSFVEPVIIPESVTTIATYAFADVNTKSIEVNGSGVSVATYAFAYSKIQSITFNGDMAFTTTYIFRDCTNLSSVTFNGDVTTLGNYMFMGCSLLTSIDLPDSLTFMGTYTFQNSGLVSIVIPEKVVNLSSSATGITASDVYLFDGCKSLTTVELPAGLITIGNYVFRNCESLDTITYTGYEGEGNALPETVALIGNYAFTGCVSLEQIDLANVATFGTYIFSYAGSSYASRTTEACTALSSVTFGSETAVTALGNYMFRGCIELTSIDLPSTLTFLGTYTFQQSGLVSIVIPESVQHIGSTANVALTSDTTYIYVFDGCESLSRVVLPSRLTTMGGYMFSNCSSLKTVTYTGCENVLEGVVVLPETLTLLGGHSFESSGVESVIIPRSLTYISNNMFGLCASLTSIIIPQSITEIRYSAFRFCTSLSEMIIPSSVSTTGWGIVEGWTEEQTIYVVDPEYFVLGGTWYLLKGTLLTGDRTNSWDGLCNAKVVYGYSPKEEVEDNP